MLALIENPDQMSKLRANPELVPALVEETLRYVNPSQGTWRIATRDTKLGDAEIPRGANVMVRLASASRDPQVFDDPDSFDITRRNAHAHFAFGRGIHVCVGSTLARREIKVCFEEMLRRMDDVRIVRDANPSYEPNMITRKLLSLEIEFKRR